MKNLLFLLLMIFSSIGALHAQFGIQASYRFNQADNWKLSDGVSDPSFDIDLLGDGWSIEVDYWFRLKNKRIEFLPALNYGSYNSFDVDVQNFDISNTVFSFFLNTNFYLFDLGSDCNCPTFNKQDDLLKKGFFLQVSPGFSRFSNEIKDAQGSNTVTANAFSIGGAIGLDIGLSEIVTLTPLVGVRYFPNVQLEGFTTTNSQIDEFISLIDEETAITQTFIGARLGFRLDKRNY